MHAQNMGSALRYYVWMYSVDKQWTMQQHQPYNRHAKFEDHSKNTYLGDDLAQHGTLETLFLVRFLSVHVQRGDIHKQSYENRH